MQRLAVIPLILLVFFLGVSRPAGAQSDSGPMPVDVELVLAADGSGSIDDEELALQRRGYAEAIAHPDVVRSILGGLHGRIAVAYI